MENGKQNQKNTGPWWKPAMQIFSEVSTWIVVPIVLALVFGKMLDAHYGTKPVIFLIFAGLGFLVTCFGMYRVVKDYMSRRPEEESGSRPESVGKKDL
jgi:F0F1-type ATP synthase assembly protein I